MKEFLQVYQCALELYKSQKFNDAWRYMTSWEERSGKQVLLSMLLKAYILREQGRYVSETDLLRELLAAFGEEDDKTRLADAWSMLGAALRMLGESRLAIESFFKSAQIEPAIDKKLVELSNAIFSANAIEDISENEMQDMYATYRNILNIPGQRNRLSDDLETANPV